MYGGRGDSKRMCSDTDRARRRNRRRPSRKLCITASIFFSASSWTSPARGVFLEAQTSVHTLIVP